MDKSTHEEQLAQPLQTINKRCKIFGTFLTVYNGILNVTNKGAKISSTASINDDDFNRITILPRNYETESLNNENRRINNKEGCFSEKNLHL